jgi:hypothetical protein
MDIDTDVIEQAVAPVPPALSSDHKKPIVVSVDDAHPFDLDAYIAGYSGPSAFTLVRYLSSDP